MRIISKLSNSDPKSCDEVSSAGSIPLEPKRAVMDLSGTPAETLQDTPRYSGDLGDVDNWDELQARRISWRMLHSLKDYYLQDKILRVLNYKYHDKEFLYLYYNQDYQNWDTLSLNHDDDEKELETQILQDYEELPKITVQVPPELRIDRSVVPSRQYAEVVSIENSSIFSRIWNVIKNVFTFKVCRKRRPSP